MTTLDPFTRVGILIIIEIVKYHITNRLIRGNGSVSPRVLMLNL